MSTTCRCPSTVRLDAVDCRVSVVVVRERNVFVARAARLPWRDHALLVTLDRLCDRARRDVRLCRCFVAGPTRLARWDDTLILRLCRDARRFPAGLVLRRFFGLTGGMTLCSEAAPSRLPAAARAELPPQAQAQAPRSRPLERPPRTRPLRLGLSRQPPKNLRSRRCPLCSRRIRSRSPSSPPRASSMPLKPSGSRR